MLHRHIPSYRLRNLGAAVRRHMAAYIYHIGLPPAQVTTVRIDQRRRAVFYKDRFWVHSLEYRLRIDTAMYAATCRLCSSLRWHIFITVRGKTHQLGSYWQPLVLHK